MRKLQLNLSPINQRRWESFKANRRGLWSLRIFLVMFLVTLCAEFIANDKPLILRYDGSLYAPVFLATPKPLLVEILKPMLITETPMLKN